MSDIDNGIVLFYISICNGECCGILHMVGNGIFQVIRIHSELKLPIASWINRGQWNNDDGRAQISVGVATVLIWVHFNENDWQLKIDSLQLVMLITRDSEGKLGKVLDLPTTVCGALDT